MFKRLMDTHLLKFLRECFSEANGQGSYSRLMSGMIVMFTVGWVTYVVIRNHAIPELAGPAGFIGAGTGFHYGVNQISTIVDSIKKNGN